MTDDKSKSIRHRIPQASMPKLMNLDQLTLHSPSNHIVGTPFATSDSTKFEYPFPDDDSSCSASSSSHATPAGQVLSPPLSSGSIYPLISASSSPPLALPGLIQPGDSSSSASSSNTSTSSFTSVHPLLKPPTNPPIPPSLVKKRPKWSLSIMNRRRSSYDNPDHDLNLVEGFLRTDGGDAVIVPHSTRDDPGRNDH